MSSAASNDEAENRNLDVAFARLEERLEGLTKLFDRSFDRLERSIEELADRFNGDVDQFRSSMDGLTDITRRVINLESAEKEIKADLKAACSRIEHLERIEAQSKVLQWILMTASAGAISALIRVIWK